MPSLLHNRPQEIAPKVEQLATRLQGEGRDVAVAYADCGTYGALDVVCQRLGLRHLAGLHCYDVFAGAEEMKKIFDDEPGTYVLTDFLVRSFRRTVLAELGLDVHPELWDDYFANYRRLVWLAQERSDALEVEAQAIATKFDVPLVIHDVAHGSLEAELEAMLDDVHAPSMREGHL
jgi:hypothetical protein